MSSLGFVSTAGRVPPVALSDAIIAGLAPDGGLYVPKRLPAIDPGAIDPSADLAAAEETMLAPFFSGDVLAGALSEICGEAFTFEAPLRSLARTDASLLELFHGPTCAFKDFGARFLAACLRRLRGPSDPPLTILVATSGDTGAAVGAAFCGLPGLRVVILYPDGRVTPRQAHQLGSFAGNVQTLRVAGSFDDCQRMVKSALNDPALAARVPLTSANSISLGRLLPQTAYYAHAAVTVRRERGVPLDLIIPTGNLGNALAAVWARAMGLPIGRIALACNANAALPTFFAGGDYRPRRSISTLASAMDVGAPSNFARLRWVCADDAALREAMRAVSVDDEAIRSTIARHARDEELILCPHTATAMHLLDREPVDEHRHRAVVATAHPAKFEQIIEPLIGEPIPLPASLAAMLERPSCVESMAADSSAFSDWLTAHAI
ncbi:MAG: threonine synthase [Gammaproteobacteria bacterium]